MGGLDGGAEGSTCLSADVGYYLLYESDFCAGWEADGDCFCRNQGNIVSIGVWNHLVSAESRGSQRTFTEIKGSRKEIGE